jgi:hypothetical protein
MSIKIRMETFAEWVIQGDRTLRWEASHGTPTTNAGE